MTAARSYFYWNLHKKCWSMMVRGRVERHAVSAQLYDVEFRVRPAGRARVLSEGRKNVHAFAVSPRCSTMQIQCSDPRRWPGEWIEVSYNPFKSAQFVRKDTGEPVTGADQVILTDSRKVFAQGLTPSDR